MSTTECKCGCGMEINNNTTQKLKAANEFLVKVLNDKELEITSGARCKNYNQILKDKGYPASPTSDHLDGNAIDSAYDGRKRRMNIITALSMAGFTRILVYNTQKIIHADNSETKEAGLYIQDKNWEMDMIQWMQIILTIVILAAIGWFYIDYTKLVDERKAIDKMVLEKQANNTALMESIKIRQEELNKNFEKTVTVKIEKTVKHIKESEIGSTITLGAD